MLPNGLFLANKVLLVFFILAIGYGFLAAPPTDIARGIGQLIPILVLALTILAAVHKGRRLMQTALVANALLCIAVSGLFLFVASSGEIVGGLLTVVWFIPFFMNTYFLARHKSIQSVP